MTDVEFETLLHDQMYNCEQILSQKGTEYTPRDPDRLSQFHLAAKLLRTTPENALCGMMAKHTTSIYEMCREIEFVHSPLSKWMEKITDHINYLILLRALVEERLCHSEEPNA